MTRISAPRSLCLRSEGVRDRQPGGRVLSELVNRGGRPCPSEGCQRRDHAPDHQHPAPQPQKHLRVGGATGLPAWAQPGDDALLDPNRPPWVPSLLPGETGEAIQNDSALTPRTAAAPGPSRRGRHGTHNHLHTHEWTERGAPKNETPKCLPRRQWAEIPLRSPVSAHGDQPLCPKCCHVAAFRGQSALVCVRD